MNDFNGSGLHFFLINLLTVKKEKNAYKNSYVSMLYRVFLAGGVETKEIKNTFDNKCEGPHQTFIYFCRRHPFGHRMLDVGSIQCSCKSLDPNAICFFCRNVAHSLNVKCFKICLYYLPDFMRNRVISIKDYFEKKISCEPFVYFDQISVKVSLDKHFEMVPARTDC